MTGASHGLGSHLSGRLAEDGWHVVGFGRREVAAASLPIGVEYLQADLSDQAVIDSLTDRLGTDFDLIVHNAVSYPSPANPADRSITDLETVFRVNALVPYLLTSRFLEAKDADRFCSIVMVNSDSIYHADQGSGLYAASKAALRVFATALGGPALNRAASVSTLLLGPLADPKKVADLRRVADSRGISESEIVKVFLRKSNPDLVIDELIDLEMCYRSLCYLVSLGSTANGMVCKLDGGSSGSLV